MVLFIRNRNMFCIVAGHDQSIMPPMYSSLSPSLHCELAKEQNKHRQAQLVDDKLYSKVTLGVFS